jgi:MFS family permease
MKSEVAVRAVQRAWVRGAATPRVPLAMLGAISWQVLNADLQFTTRTHHSNFRPPHHLSYLQEELSLSPSEMGGMETAFLAAYAVGQFTLTPYGDIYGPRVMLTAIFLIVGFVCPIPPSFLALETRDLSATSGFVRPVVFCDQWISATSGCAESSPFHWRGCWNVLFAQFGAIIRVCVAISARTSSLLGFTVLYAISG